MPLDTCKKKESVVAEVNEAAVAADALSAVAAEYRGLTVEQMTELRREGARERCLPASGQEHVGSPRR